MVDVEGASDTATARDLARAVAGGSLVKAGLFGGDPSWGRILATLGARCGARGFSLDINAVSLDIQATRVFEAGAPRAFDVQDLSARMRKPEIAVRLDLGAGAAKDRALGSVGDIRPPIRRGGFVPPPQRQTSFAVTKASRVRGAPT